MIDSERGRCNANVPFHLPDALEYKFSGCIPDHPIISHGWQVTGSQWQCRQDSDGGGWLRTDVYAACRGYVVYCLCNYVTGHG